MTHARLTPESLAALRTLLEKATPGPWQACGCGRCGLLWSLPLDTTVGNASGQPEADSDVCQLSAEQQHVNAELCAAIRNAAAALLSAAEFAERKPSVQTEADEFHRKLARFLEHDTMNSVEMLVTTRGDAFRANVEGVVRSDGQELTVSETGTGPTPLAALANVLRKVKW